MATTDLKKMLNFRSVSIRGAFNFSRARVLWQNGVIKVFDTNGLVMETKSDRPQKKPGFIRAWDVEMPGGTITLRGKCITCGGKKWWRIAYMSSDELWSLT